MISSTFVRSLFKAWRLEYKRRKDDDVVSICYNLDDELEGLTVTLKYDKEFSITLETLCIDEFCCYEQTQEDIEEVFNQFNEMKLTILKKVSCVDTLFFRYIGEDDPTFCCGPSWSYVKKNNNLHEFCYKS